MAKFRHCDTVLVDATQWFRNGDHPHDGNAIYPTSGRPAGQVLEGRVVRYFRRPDVPGDSICLECSEPYRVHGWIETKMNGWRVCPGDWIVTGVHGEVFPVKPGVFVLTYEAVPQRGS